MKRLKRIILCLLPVAILISAAWWWIAVYDNYHTVIEGELYRSAQLSGRELRAYIKTDRLATVINLRDDIDAIWWKKEKALCQQEDIKHIDIPLSGDSDPTIEQMTRLVKAFEANERPILIHCKHGADRTALAVALYGLTQGHSNAKPTSAFSARYGHLPSILRKTKRFDDAYTRYRTMRSQHTPAAAVLKPQLPHAQQ